VPQDPRSCIQPFNQRWWGIIWIAKNTNRQSAHWVVRRTRFHAACQMARKRGTEKGPLFTVFERRGAYPSASAARRCGVRHGLLRFARRVASARRLTAFESTVWFWRRVGSAMGTTRRPDYVMAGAAAIVEISAVAAITSCPTLRRFLRNGACLRRPFRCKRLLTLFGP
jgi:hypothetical protein